MKKLILIPLLFFSLIMVLALVGCNTFRPSPAEVPSEQRTPYVLNAHTLEALQTAIGGDAQVFASTLDSVQESGNAIYIDHSGIVYTAAGEPFVINGQIVRVSTKVIAKLNSMHNLESLQGIEELEYDIGGYEWIKNIPETWKNRDLPPQALRLRVKGIETASVSPATPAIIAAYAAEKGAIFTGMSEYAEAKGVAFAVKVEALHDGFARVITASGREIVGRITGTYAIDAGVEGVTRAAGFFINGQQMVTEGDNCVPVLGE